MNKNDIKLILKKKLKTEKIYINGDDKHFEIIIISNDFIGMNKVKRHQLVYNPLIKYIEKNLIHAISMKTYTTEEWETK